MNVIAVWIQHDDLDKIYLGIPGIGQGDSKGQLSPKIAESGVWYNTRVTARGTPATFNKMPGTEQTNYAGSSMWHALRWVAETILTV